MTPESFMNALTQKLKKDNWGTIEIQDFDKSNPSDYFEDMKQIVESIFEEQTAL